MFGINPAHLWRNKRTTIIAMRTIAAVAKPPHQFGPGSGDPIPVPTLLGGRPGKAETWQRGNNQVKSIGRVTPMRTRISKRFNQIEVFDYRHRPAMGENQGSSIGFGRFNM